MPPSRSARLGPISGTVAPRARGDRDDARARRLPRPASGTQYPITLHACMVRPTRVCFGLYLFGPVWGSALFCSVPRSAFSLCVRVRPAPVSLNSI